MTKQNLIISLGFLALLSIAGLGIWYYMPQLFISRTHTGIVDYQKSRDKEAILDLINKNWYWLVAEDAKDFYPERILDYRAYDKTPESHGKVTIKVMLEEGKPVGFIAYYMKKFYEGFIWLLAVKDEARNKKYGRQLMQIALDDFKSCGVHYVRLITRTNNYPGQALYKRLGFRETWRDDRFIDYEKVMK